jgi:hypothetical protein
MKPRANYKYMDTLMLIGLVNVSNRRSTNGFMFSFGSGVVNWSNKKQPTIALSNMEAEYIGATIAACEVVRL